MKLRENLNLVPYDDSYLNSFIQAYRSVYGSEPYFESFTEDEIKEVTLQERLYLLIDEKGDVIGFVSGMPLSNLFKKKDLHKLNLEAVIGNPNDTFYIGELGIVPEVQGEGLGKEIFQLFLSIMENEGYKRFVLCTADKNNKAQGLYEKTGFQKLTDKQDNIIYREISHLRLDGTTKTDNRPYYLRQKS